MRPAEPPAPAGVTLPPSRQDASADVERTRLALSAVREGLEQAGRALDALAVRCTTDRLH